MTTPAELLSIYTNQSQMSSFFIDKMKIVNVLSYGVIGDGLTNDTLKINDAITACNDGDILYFPNIICKITPTLTINKELRICGNVTFMVYNSGNYDYAINVTSKCNISDMTIDQSNVTAHSGRGEGIRLSASDTFLDKVTVIGEGSLGGVFSSGIVILNDNVVITNSNVSTTGYGGIAIKVGNNTIISQCIITNPKVKGIVSNTASDKITIKDCKITTNSIDSNSDGILIDGSTVDSVVIDSCEIYGFLSNDIKIKSTTLATVRSTRLKSTLSVYSIYVDATEAFLYGNSYANRMTILNHCEFVTIDGGTIDASGQTFAIGHNGYQLYVKNIHLKNCVNAIYFRTDGYVSNQNIVLQNIDVTCTAVTGHLLAFPAGIDFLGTDHIKLDNVNIIVGDADLYNGLTGSSTYDKQVQRTTRFFRTKSLPTAGTCKAGDIIWNTEPTSAGSTPNKYIIIGWVRLTDGTAHVLNTDWAEMRTLTGT